MRNITFLFSQILALFVFIAFSSICKAQLVGWKYKDAISIQENSGTAKLNHQVLLTINTQTYISANKMNATGSDIRFAKDCNGSVLYSYWIESGINTTATQIWVLIDSLPANGSRTINMYYGNTTALATSSFDSTFTPASRLIVSAGSAVLTGVNNYSWFEVQSGASITVTPNVSLTINARKIIVAGSINGNGAGFLGGTPGTNGSGPGGGFVSSGNFGSYGAGGAGYGGAGGNGGGWGSATSANVGQPGVVYGTFNTDSIDMGSGGGGATSGGQGGNGGAGITLNGDVVNITGVITANGSDGTPTVLNGAGGGGSGGGIKVKGNSIMFSGTLSANGGNGEAGGGGGGGGGGGRIKIFSDASISNTGTMTVAAGLPGSPNAETVPQTGGTIGTTFVGTYISGVPTFLFLPKVLLTTSANTICQGSTVTFTALTGFSNYAFYVNADTAQNGTGNTYTTDSLANNDTIKVVATYASSGCGDTSNIIIITVNPAPLANAGSDVIICSGSSTQLTASGGTLYSWIPASGLSNPNISNPIASPAVTTSYIVVVGNASGCYDADTVVVTVDPCTGISNNTSSDNGLSVTPNPSFGQFYVSPSDMNIIDWEVMNMLGEKVYAEKTVVQNNSGNKIKVDISDLPDGLYFLKLRSGEATIVKKIIKK